MRTRDFYPRGSKTSKWLAPQTSADSDIEVEDELLEEAMDDEALDPDFLLNMTADDLTPAASGKHKQCTML